VDLNVEGPAGLRYELSDLLVKLLVFDMNYQTCWSSLGSYCLHYVSHQLWKGGSSVLPPTDLALHERDMALCRRHLPNMSLCKFRLRILMTCTENVAELLAHARTVPSTLSP